MQDLYISNYILFMREIKENLNKWAATPNSWLGRLINENMSVLPKLTYRLSAVPVKVSAFLVKINQLISHVHIIAKSHE